MNQQSDHNGTVHKKLETAIEIGCTMVSRSKSIRKKLNSGGDDKVSIKESLKELDRMSIELIDKLFEINARIDLPAERPENADQAKNKFRSWFDRILNNSRRKLESMRLTYQEMFML